MENINEETIIISLGGSLIVPEEIDMEFLKDFKRLIVSQIEKGKKFVIITGGGKICRKYQNVARELVNPPTVELDWIGIASLKLNAELLRVIFGEFANKEVISDLREAFVFEKPVIIGSACEPGQSTDFDAVSAAQSANAKKIVNLSNIDYAYDKDPNKFPDAKKLEKVSWEEYRSLIPSEWNPGLSTPFDPIASKEAQKNGFEIVIMNGKNLENLENYFNGENFIGTTIN